MSGLVIFFSCVVAANLSEGQATSAVEMLIECLGSGDDNVGLSYIFFLVL